MYDPSFATAVKYARPHAANATKARLDPFGWGILNRLVYSPDLAPSDFYLFTFPKTHMGGKKFQTDEEVKQAVLKWTKEMAGEFHEEVIKKLVPKNA